MSLMKLGKGNETEHQGRRSAGYVGRRERNVGDLAPATRRPTAGQVVAVEDC